MDEQGGGGEGGWRHLESARSVVRTLRGRTPVSVVLLGCCSVVSQNQELKEAAADFEAILEDVKTGLHVQHVYTTELEVPVLQCGNVLWTATTSLTRVVHTLAHKTDSRTHSHTLFLPVPRPLLHALTQGLPVLVIARLAHATL